MKYAHPLVSVILAIFAGVVYRKISSGWSEVVPLAVAAVIVWVIGVPVFIFLWPRITVTGLKRAILKHGFSGGPIPVNTLYAEPNRSSASPTGSLIGMGTKAEGYLLSGPGWKGTVPYGKIHISSPNNSTLIIGEVFVANSANQLAADALAQQIQLTPLKQ